MKKSIKTAISLPGDTFRRAEEFRRKSGKSRSELYAQALSAFLGVQELRDREARYVTGYQAKPESLAEGEALAKASVSAFELEDW